VLIKYPEEQLDSLEEVAKKSAYYVREIIKGDFFLDDSGIFINELKGFPGVYSSYVNKTIGNPGILKLMENARDRSAQFSTCIAYYDGTVNLFVGKTSGTISTTERGRNGFGFDPIFIPDGYEETYAEMPLEKKNSLSHRFKAANLFLEFLKKKKI
jgi:XTP/dITP diphosphohydrolase